MFKKILVSKIFIHKGSIIVLSKIFCLTGPKNFVKGPFRFTKLLVSKKFMDKSGGGGEEVSRFSGQNFLPHTAEKFRRGTLL